MKYKDVFLTLKNRSFAAVNHVITKLEGNDLEKSDIENNEE